MQQVIFQQTTISVVEHTDHIFILTSKDVAVGYGVSESVLRSHRQNQADELIEGKHFIVDRSYKNTPKTYWTKRGVVRLGFFIKSERAKAFRDWAEDYVINKQNDANYVPYNLLYSKERECIELKRAMNRMTENEKLIFNDPQTHNEVLDLIGYASRATKTIKHLGQELLEYGTNMEAKLASIQKKHANKNGVTSQCNRLPRHQERRD